MIASNYYAEVGYFPTNLKRPDGSASATSVSTVLPTSSAFRRPP